jgi:hypothetical protein
MVHANTIIELIIFFIRFYPLNPLNPRSYSNP